MRHLSLRLENGEIWGIPVNKIASHYALTRASAIIHDEQLKADTFNREYEWMATSDDIELLDWFFNSMPVNSTQWVKIAGARIKPLEEMLQSAINSDIIDDIIGFVEF